LEVLLAAGAARDRRALDAFDAIKAVRDGTEWKTNVTHQPTVIFSDISNGTLPAVSWVVPDDVNSDHPGNGTDTGPSWVASIVNAVGESKYWHSTTVIVVWDDWGGFYDHVRPPFFDRWGGLGFRVPMLIVSAYSREGTSKQRGYVSHTQYEFGSILKFVEDIWDWDGLERPIRAPPASPIVSTLRNLRERSSASHRRIPENILSINRRRTSRSIRNRP